MKLHIRQAHRTGYTLIELLVVIAIIVILASLSALVASSGLFENYRNVGANDRVSGWLITSKAWAQREKAPRGVRFVIVSGVCREAQYIEVPVPYVPAGAKKPAPNPNNPPVDVDSSNPPRVIFASGQLYFTGVDGTVPGVLAGQDDLTMFLANVTQNDSIQLGEYNTLLRITSPPTLADIPGTKQPGNNSPIKGILIPVNALLLPKLGITTHYQTTSFAVHRQAQPLMGEPMLQVPNGMLIDFAPGRSVANINADLTVDVLFSANGDVMNNASGMTILWLRKDIPPASYTPAANGGGLTVVYTRTGAVATHPINTSTPPTTNPYLYAQDGINTGF